MPLGTTVTRSASSPNSAVASSRMPVEQAITASARCASHRSTEWMARLSGSGSQPWWRPASVACRVATSAAPVVSVSVIALCATSQSWAWTTCGRQRLISGSAARSSACSLACAQARSVSVVKSMARGSAAARMIRTPSTVSVRPMAASPRVTTRTSWPSAARCRASASTCRPRPPTRSGGYSHDRSKTRTASDTTAPVRTGRPVTLAGVTTPRPPLPRMLIAGVVVVLLGLVSWAIYGVQAGRENYSFDPQGAPPKQVRLVAGHTYWLAVPGGLSRVRQAGLDPVTLACTATAPGRTARELEVTAVVTHSTDDSKFANRIGSFVAPRTGRLRVSCAGLGTVYVENAADAGFDWSGWWLVLASAALVVGFPLVVSGLRRPAPAATDDSAAETREYDEVE